MSPRERAVVACKPFPVPRRMIECFPNLIGRDAPNDCGETYFTDENLGGAIAMPASEAQLLSEIVTCAGPDRLVEIGAYVGWSTAALLDGFEPFASQKLAVIDPFTESKEPGYPTEARFWENLDRVCPRGQTLLFRGHSPEILPIVKPRFGWGFAFIDGAHINGQPLRDIKGLLPCLTEDAIVVWHDGWLPDVQRAIDWLWLQEGWRKTTLPTASTLTICHRGETLPWLDDIEAKAREYAAMAQ